jgi:hypothetical protein
MPRPGFYNDNEYRAYPFIYVANYEGPELPDSAVVDAGFILGLNSGFEAGTHTVWLSAVTRAAGQYEFTFRSDAPGLEDVNIVFERAENADPWSTEYASSDAETAPEDCTAAPLWEGFLVTGPLADLAACIAPGQTITFSAADRVLEPGRLQSLVRSYVRSVNLGNLSRVQVLPPVGDAYSECSDSISATDRYVVVNARCMQGNLKVREGYNCRIKQIDRTNELRIGAEKNAGTPLDAEQCQYGGELPLYPSEPLPADSKFFSGGPACNELITTINGVGGPNVNILNGTGVTVTVDHAAHAVRVSLATNNLAGNCTADGGA